MDRREFLKTSLAASMLPVLPFKGLIEFDSPLVRECRRAATSMGLRWTGAIAERACAEAVEITAAKADRALLRLAEVAQSFRNRGVAFAPAFGRTGSSLVAYLLGVSSIDPIEHEITFDAVVPRTCGNRLELGLAVESTAVNELTKALRPVRVEKSRLFDNFPETADMQIDDLSLFLVPMAASDGRRPSNDEEFFAGALAEPFRAYLDAYRPADADDLGMAIAIFRPGQRHELLLEIRNGLLKPAEPLIGPRTTFGCILYREDALAVIQNWTGWERLDAARLIRTIGRRDAADTRNWQSKWVTSALERGLSDQESRWAFDFLCFWAGYVFMKSHAVALAAILQSPDPRQSVFAFDLCAAGSRDGQWAWSLASTAGKGV